MPRREMTYRVVPLGSAEAASVPRGRTAGECLDMLDELSRLAWNATGRSLPSYSRAEMPIRLSTLGRQGLADEP